MRFIRRRTALIAALALLAQASPSFAINWEGKDEWLDETAEASTYGEAAPPAPQAPLPSCAERETARKSNPYEQAPVPGLNCVTAPVEATE